MVYNGTLHSTRAFTKNYNKTSWAQLYTKPSKFSFAHKGISIMGYSVEQSRICMDPKRMLVILNLSCHFCEGLDRVRLPSSNLSNSPSNLGHLPYIWLQELARYSTPKVNSKGNSCVVPFFQSTSIGTRSGSLQCCMSWPQKKDQTYNATTVWDSKVRLAIPHVMSSASAHPFFNYFALKSHKTSILHQDLSWCKVGFIYLHHK